MTDNSMTKYLKDLDSDILIEKLSKGEGEIIYIPANKTITGHTSYAILRELARKELKNRYLNNEFALEDSLKIISLL